MGDRIIFASEAEMPYLTMSLGTTLYNKTGTWRYVRPVYHDKTPPCNNSCPAGEKIQGYLDLVKEERYAAAWALLREDNPFPAVCGRVCYHPCEQSCNRGQFDTALGIHNVERFLGDYGLEMVASGALVPPAKKLSAPTVAVIGAGPAGLSCAYHLARRGHGVTVFEALPVAGGMLAVGIPNYRLPKVVLQAEISLIEALGVEIKRHTRVGVDVTLDQLRWAEAIFVAIGAHRSLRLSIPEEEAQGVIHGTDFLRQLALGEKPALHGRVIVVGGGNTAMDCARSARRLGAPVTIAYRRTRAEMPAIDEEIDDALAEGVEILYLTAPRRVIVEHDRVAGLQCQKMRLGEPDASGRRQPIPIEGSEFVLEARHVIAAIGQESDLSFLPEGVRATSRGIVVDGTGETTRAGVFAGGDVAAGVAQRVVDAIGSGKRAALAIDRYLRHQEAPLEAEPALASFEMLNLDYFAPAERVAMPQLPMAQRVAGFGEVNLGYTTAQAVTEAERCFSCGVCNHCDNCYLFCPDVAVHKLAADGYEFDYDYCKGCGICAEECPRNAIDIEEELGRG
jgi:2-oxoacid:acceptor oxidoreductase delta subunit (pyruvate/2-ketoisovalerate family)